MKSLSTFFRLYETTFLKLTDNNNREKGKYQNIEQKKAYKKYNEVSIIYYRICYCMLFVHVHHQTRKEVSWFALVALSSQFDEEEEYLIHFISIFVIAKILKFSFFSTHIIVYKTEYCCVLNSFCYVVSVIVDRELKNQKHNETRQAIPLSNVQLQFIHKSPRHSTYNFSSHSLLTLIQCEYECMLAIVLRV